MCFIHQMPRKKIVEHTRPSYFKNPSVFYHTQCKYCSINSTGEEWIQKFEDHKHQIICRQTSEESKKCWYYTARNCHKFPAKPARNCICIYVPKNLEKKKIIIIIRIQFSNWYCKELPHWTSCSYLQKLK